MLLFISFSLMSVNKLLPWKFEGSLENLCDNIAIIPSKVLFNKISYLNVFKNNL